VIAPTAAVAAFRRVDASPIVTRDAAASRAGLAALVRAARATRRLPTAARAASAHHALSPALPAPAALHRLVTALTGRLTVVNHPPAAALDAATVALVRGLAWAALYGAGEGSASVGGAGEGAAGAAPPAGTMGPGDGRPARERARVRAWCAAAAAHGANVAWLAGGGARWVSAALYEQDAPAVHTLPDDGRRGGGGEPPVPGYAVALRYRMVVLAGDAEPPGWDALDAAAAVAAGVGFPEHPWFAGRLLVPDAWATARMAPDVRAAWAGVTGRTGGTDRYWYPETWTRFLEPGRVVGCVSAAEVARSRPGRLRGADAPAPHPARPAWDAPAASSPFAADAARIERGICVPPGYCLVDCAGTLGVALARVPAA
jgi:hypothetical protein